VERILSSLLILGATIDGIFRFWFFNIKNKPSAQMMGIKLEQKVSETYRGRRSKSKVFRPNQISA